MTDPAGWEDRVGPHLEEWIGVATSTAPSPHEEAEEAVAALYRLNGRSPPSFVWYESPRGCILAVRRHTGLGGVLRERPRWRDNAVRAAISGRAGETRIAAASLLLDRLTPIVEDGLRAPVWAALADSLRELRISPPSSFVHNACFGQHAADLGCYTSFCRQVLGLDLSRVFPLYERITRSCGWFTPFEHVCFLAERPVALSLARGPRPGNRSELLLHDERGPAMRFADGFACYCWDGSPVPRRLIEDPDSLTGSEIVAEPSTQLRELMLRRLGLERLLPISSIVDSSRWGRLREVATAAGDRVRFVELTDASSAADRLPQQYLRRVPPDCRPTALAAVSWTFALDEDHYDPLEET